MREAKSLPQRGAHAENGRFKLSPSFAPTSLLVRMKRQERQMEALENTAVLHDVPETKGVGDGERKPYKNLHH